MSSLELPTNDRPNSIVDCLQKLALSKPDATAYIFLQNGETETSRITYRELNERASSIASHLQSYKGERALMLYPSGLEFIAAFFGCLYAGVIAVPVYPPTKRDRKLSRLLSIINDAEPKIALTANSILTDIQQRWEENIKLTHLKWIATDSIDAGLQDFAPRSPTQETLAFLQYTSGSTGKPKGVMVSHGNLMDNEEAVALAFGHDENTIFVGWLPLFHDMGLIGNVLQPLYLGIPCILMPPVAFIQKPIRWLKAISKYRATTSGGPNFAYDLCVQKVKPEQLANLDLSSWDVAYNGAEPIRAKTLLEFREKFAPCGFKKEAFYPCYGMAETTLFATGGLKNREPIVRDREDLGTKPFVGCGQPWLDTQVIIVDPQTNSRCSDGEIGEIWVSGKSVAKGYWNRPKLTQETFAATLGETGDAQFLRTGDLGFIVNNELFVTGRLKDTIIIRGQNHYPQDIEHTVQETHPALRANGGAVVTVEANGQEKLVIIQEVERSYLKHLDLNDIKRKITVSVTERHSLAIHAIVLIKPGSLPKTSSGKIQRHICRQQFLNNELKDI